MMQIDKHGRRDAVFSMLSRFASSLSVVLVGIRLARWNPAVVNSPEVVLVVGWRCTASSVDCACWFAQAPVSFGRRCLVISQHESIVIIRTGPSLTSWAYIVMYSCSGLLRDSIFVGTLHLKTFFIPLQAPGIERATNQIVFGWTNDKIIAAIMYPHYMYYLVARLRITSHPRRKSGLTIHSRR